MTAAMLSHALAVMLPHALVVMLPRAYRLGECQLAQKLSKGNFVAHVESLRRSGEAKVCRYFALRDDGVGIATVECKRSGEGFKSWVEAST